MLTEQPKKLRFCCSLRDLLLNERPILTQKNFAARKCYLCTSCSVHTTNPPPFCTNNIATIFFLLQSVLVKRVGTKAAHNVIPLPASSFLFAKRDTPPPRSSYHRTALCLTRCLNEAPSHTEINQQHKHELHRTELKFESCSSFSIVCVKAAAVKVKSMLFNCFTKQQSTKSREAPQNQYHAMTLLPPKGE